MLMNDRAKASAREVLDRYLEIGGHRKTAERYTILDLICGMKGLFTIEDIDDKLKNENNFPVSRPTLYNTLKLFLELRLVIRHSFPKGTFYETCIGKANVCHQICNVCGSVKEITIPEIEQILDEVQLKRFRREGFSLVVYGICSSCAAKMTRLVNKENKRKNIKQNEK